MGKYDSLRDHLMRCSARVSLTFVDVADLVGGLPASAYEWPQWWENDAGHVQARAWLEAGYRTEAIDLEGRRLTLVRE